MVMTKKTRKMLPKIRTVGHGGNLGEPGGNQGGTGQGGNPENPGKTGEPGGNPENPENPGEPREPGRNPRAIAPLKILTGIEAKPSS